jgi:hypothetical protein
MKRSEVSAITTKTNKTSGNHVDKYCLACTKKISGKNWGVHVTKVHNGVAPPFTRQEKV